MAKKLETAKASGAEVLVTADAGCMMHLAGGLARRGETMTIMHIAQLLVSG
jgi:L-lactate dehydrogenase complex protein LldE